MTDRDVLALAIEMHAAAYPDDGSHWDGWHDLTSADRTYWIEHAQHALKQEGS